MLTISERRQKEYFSKQIMNPWVAGYRSGTWRQEGPEPPGLNVGSDTVKRLAFISVLTSYHITVKSNYAYVLVSETKEQELWQLRRSV
ncbi:hypothetical protein R6Z07F_002652 [Ovis aries]